VIHHINGKSVGMTKSLVGIRACIESIAVWSLACFLTNCFGQQVVRDPKLILSDVVEMEDRDQKKRTIDVTAERLRQHSSLSAKLNLTLECVDGFYFPTRMAGAVRVLESSENLAKLFDPYVGKIRDLTNEGYWEFGKQTIRHIYDASGESVRADYKPDIQTVLLDSKSKKLFLGPKGDPISWIDTPEHFVELYTNHAQGQLSNFPPLPFLENTFKRIAFRKPRKSFNRPTRFPNVESYLRLNESISFVDALEGWKKAVEEQNSLLRIYFSASHLVFRLRMSDGGERFLGVNAVDQYVEFYDAFDATGRLLVHREHTFGKGSVVPSRMVDYEASARPNGPPIFYRELTLIANENTGVRKTDFSVNEIGLTYGERVVDEIENRLLIVDHGNKLTPVEDFRYELHHSKISTRMFMLFGGLSIASVFVIYMVSRRQWAQ
jgi:hypothetical protein